MRFLLEPGDAALALPCPQEELRGGEIALLVKWEAGRPAGYIIHRVLFNARLAGRRFLLTKGDANFLPDLPPSALQAVAKIISASRAGRTWSASPGPAWPLAAAYSFAANKLMSGLIYSAFLLFSAAVFCLPRFLSALLNSLYLYWEAGLYPAALHLVSSVARPSGAAGTPAAAGGVKSGRITEDETWSGKITVADYLIIERGVRITVQPGSEIDFTRREPWFFPVLRAGADGARRELDSSLAKVLVYGVFSASGTPDSPVIFSGVSFGGLHALEEGRIVLRDCRLENSAACALTARDGAAAELERCSFSFCRGGTEASGFSLLSLKDCLFSDSGGPALRLLDSSLSSASGCAVRGCSGPAVEAGGEASAALYAFSASNCASGIEASGLSALRLGDCRFEGNAGHALQLRGAARLEAAGCIVSGNAAGLSARGKNLLRLSDCGFTGGRGPAVEIFGRNSLTAGNCSFSGGASGIEGGGLNLVELSSCSFASIHGPGVELARAAGFRAKSCVFTGCGAGIRLEDCRPAWPGMVPAAGSPGPAVELSSCSFASIPGHGVELARAAGFRAASCDFSGCGAGIRLEDCRPARLEGVSVSGGRGPALELCGSNSLEVLNCSFSGGASGIEGKGFNLVKLSSCSFSSTRGPGIELARAAGFSALSCDFSGCGAGIRLEDCRPPGFLRDPFPGSRGPAVELSSCSFTSIGGHGVELARAADFRAKSCGFTGCGAGIRLEDCRSAALEGVSVSGARGPGLYARGAGSLKADRVSFKANATGADIGGSLSSRLAAAVFEDQNGPAAVFSGRASALITASSFSGNISGVSAREDTSLDLRGCVFKNNGGPSLEISDRSALSLSDTVSSGSPAALTLSGLASASLSRFNSRSSSAPAVSLSGKASLLGRNCSFFSETDAVYAEGSGELSLHSCGAVSASGAALKLGIRRARLESVRAEGSGGLNLRPGGTVTTRDLEILARDYAIESAAASFSARGLEARGGTRGGVMISSGKAVIREAALAGSPYPGLAAAAGAVLKAGGVCFEGKPWEPPPRPAARPRRLLFLFASCTAELPVFRQLYRLVYLAAVPAARTLLAVPGVSSLYLYRGMASSDWVPVLSDMDLACALHYSSPEGDWEVYSRLKARLRLLKALFPFTGEVLCAGRKQLAAFIAGWGVKGAEFKASSRLLAGRPLDRAGGGSEATRFSGQAVSNRSAAGHAADDTEAFYSYTLLLSHLFSEDLPGNFRRRNCLKGLVDVKRYLDKDAADRISRSAYAKRAGLPLGRYRVVPELHSAFEAFRALHSAAGAASASGRPCPVPAAPPSYGFNRHAFGAACARLEADCGVGLGVVLDALYRVYIVLPDSAAGDEALFVAVSGALRRARPAYPFLSAAPLLLTGASFSFLSRLPYLNNPLFPLDLSLGGGGAGGPGCGGVYVYNLPWLPPLQGDENLRAGAVLAARHFSASWRSLWAEMPPHYFYTRAAGLRLLLETGETPAFSRPAELGDAFQKKYGGSAAGWGSYSAGGAGRENYLFVSAQAEALTELADGI